jgi:hypothetical protein
MLLDTFRIGLLTILGQLVVPGDAKTKKAQQAQDEKC